MEFHTFVYANRASGAARRIDESRSFLASRDDSGYCIDAPDAIPAGSTQRIDPVDSATEPFAAPITALRRGYISGRH
ncbi:hypothetical protein [Burkholderia cenocepacia]|uniref:hypothetical protein n=1 Tax=Burkholderia cenocepacia TaxID=95486 RepID=UPI002ABD8D69|nr:hypothetical protein [Burkholderia cenocepacia]